MEFIWVCNNTTNMYTKFFYFFFRFTTTINKNIIWFWRFFFYSASCVYCRPSKNTFYNTVFGVNINHFTWCNLVITSTISNHINKSVITYIIHIPRNFIGMPFNNYFIFSFWVYNSNSCSVSICNKFIHIRF